SISVHNPNGNNSRLRLRHAYESQQKRPDLLERGRAVDRFRFPRRQSVYERKEPVARPATLTPFGEILSLGHFSETDGCGRAIKRSSNLSCLLSSRGVAVGYHHDILAAQYVRELRKPCVSYAAARCRAGVHP